MGERSEKDHGQQLHANFSSGNDEVAYIIIPRESKRAATQGSEGTAVVDDNNSDDLN